MVSLSSYGNFMKGGDSVIFVFLVNETFLGGQLTCPHRCTARQQWSRDSNGFHPTRRPALLNIGKEEVSGAFLWKPLVAMQGASADSSHFLSFSCMGSSTFVCSSPLLFVRDPFQGLQSCLKLHILLNPLYTMFLYIYIFIHICVYIYVTYIESLMHRLGTETD